ncbi:MAG: NAD-dependent epimerase/dehydratase family protein [Actinomycetia bacterium]|nr:NAD-dependent epimerase/dehydratase family protein [Actinomycetes bacterium]
MTSAAGPGPTLDGRSIAVTGAAGFIGCHVVAELERCGARVLAIDSDPGWREPLLEALARDRVEMIATGHHWPYPEASFDLLDSQLAVETIVHLAYAVPRTDNLLDVWQQEVAANLLPTVALFEALPDSVEQVLFASTALVYGHTRRGPLCESLPPQPDSAYAQTKAAVECCLSQWAEETGRSATSLRLATVYGPTETVPRAIPNFIRRLLDGRAPQVAVAGDVRDYIHVADVARAVARSVAHPSEHSVLNVGTGRSTRTDNLAELIAATLGSDLEPEVDDAARSPIEVVVDPRRISEATGFTATIGLADGLAGEIDWFAARPELWASC